MTLTHPPSTVAIEDACERFLIRAQAIRIHHVIAGALELGQAAVEELYGGDPDLIHDRSAARKDPMAVLVARHADQLNFLGLNVERIRTAMTAWEVNSTLPPAAQGRLTSTQLRVLSVIPSPDRPALALQAVQDAWSIGETRAQIGQFRLEQGLVGKGGRPPLPQELKGIRAAQRELEALGDPARASGFDLDLKRQLRAELHALRRATQAWLASLK